MTQFKLIEQFRWRVVYEDKTRFGSAVTHRSDIGLRNACSKIAAYRQQHGLAAVVAQSRELLTAVREGELSERYENHHTLRQDWLYPDARLVRPIALIIENENGQAVAQITPASDLWQDLAAYLGDWAWGNPPPLNPSALALWQTLSDYNLLVEATPQRESNLSALGDATFVGHSTVQIRDNSFSLLIDPFLFPQSNRYPATYQPLGVTELGHPSAVLITHSHPDHYDLGSLLRFRADTPIYVPEVEQESVLSVNIQMRLKQLGFRKVSMLRWFETVTVGNLQVIALPFFGEQPTVSHRLHPEVRNAGNTYLVKRGEWLIGVTADSGQDQQGDVKAVAADALQQYGTLDVLFGGYRGFSLYPIQYCFSSVASYLTFVPEPQWQVRQRTMCDASDLIDVGELWQTRLTIPYSDGGAPWYWQRGLGPVLDGSGINLPNVDPMPETVIQAAALRSGTAQGGTIASPIPVKILRPGQSLHFQNDKDIDILQTKVWPYNSPADTVAGLPKL